MIKGLDKLRIKLARGGILVCQTLFFSILLTSVVALIGIEQSLFYLPLLGGILLFNTALMYLRAMDETGAYRAFTKCALAGLSAFVGAAGMAISLGMLKHEYSLAMQPLPLLLIVPFIMTFLEAGDNAASSES